jgi:hypothetical protein
MTYQPVFQRVFLFNKIFFLSVQILKKKIRTSTFVNVLQIERLMFENAGFLGFMLDDLA